MSRIYRRALSIAGRRGRRIPRVPATGVLGIVGVVLGILVFLLLRLHANEKAVPRTSPVPATQESLAIGAQLYASNCQVCHGPRGEGSALAAALTLHVPILNDGSMFVRIREGFPTKSEPKTMPAFGDQLTETEHWHLVNFLRDAFGQGAFEPVLPEEMLQ